jgi:5-methylcytosine-specific restriction protein A
MTRREISRKAADQKRRDTQPWRKWYFTKAWKLRRKRQLDRVAWCEPCKRAGRSRPATIANHKIPHRGDRELFFRGELESACKQCHDQAIQREELEGFSREVSDADGWPADPRHPFNRAAKVKPGMSPPAPPKRPWGSG